MPNDPSSSPILTLRQQIADRLRSEILSGHHPSGTRLPEVELAKRFNVSRGPIRDVLLQLTQEGLLVARSNAGVRVCHPVSDDLRPLIVKLRKDIEGAAVERFFKQSPRPSLAPIARNLALFKLACEERDLKEVVRLDMAFHRLLVELAKEPEMLSIWVPVTSRMMLRYSRHTDLKEVWTEHRRILDALEKGKRREALTALLAHIQ